MKYKNKIQPQSLCRRLAGCRGLWCPPWAPALDVCLRTPPDPPRDPVAQAGARAGGPCRAPAHQARLSAVCWAGCEHPAVLTASSCAYSIQLCLQHPPSWGKSPCFGTATAPGNSEIPWTGSCGPAFLVLSPAVPSPPHHALPVHPWGHPVGPWECPRGLAPVHQLCPRPWGVTSLAPGAVPSKPPSTIPWNYEVIMAGRDHQVKHSTKYPVPTDPWPEVTHLPMSGSFPDPPIPCSLLCLLFLWFLPHSVPWAIPFLTTNSWLILPSFNSGFSIHLLSLSWLPPLSPRMLSLTSLCCPRPCQGMPITPGGELAPC